MGYRSIDHLIVYYLLFRRGIMIIELEVHHRDIRDTSASETLLHIHPRKFLCKRLWPLEDSRVILVGQKESACILVRQFYMDIDIFILVERAVVLRKRSKGICGFSEWLGGIVIPCGVEFI